MKRVLAVVLIVLMMLSITACGASKQSITSISGKTTKTQLESMIQGTVKAGSSLPGNTYYFLGDGGGSFLGLTVGKNGVAFAIRDGEKTINYLNINGVYAGDNKEIIDQMLVDLTKKHGTPSVSGSEYLWGDDISFYISDSEKRFELRIDFD